MRHCIHSICKRVNNKYRRCDDCNVWIGTKHNMQTQQWGPKDNYVRYIYNNKQPCHVPDCWLDKYSAQNCLLQMVGHGSIFVRAVFFQKWNKLLFCINSKPSDSYLYANWMHEAHACFTTAHDCQQLKWQNVRHVMSLLCRKNCLGMIKNTLVCQNWATMTSGGFPGHHSEMCTNKV